MTKKLTMKVKRGYLDHGEVEWAIAAFDKADKDPEYAAELKDIILEWRTDGEISKSMHAALLTLIQRALINPDGHVAKVARKCDLLVPEITGRIDFSVGSH